MKASFLSAHRQIRDSSDPESYTGSGALLFSLFPLSILSNEQIRYSEAFVYLSLAVCLYLPVLQPGTFPSHNNNAALLWLCYAAYAILAQSLTYSLYTRGYLSYTFEIRLSFPSSSLSLNHKLTHSLKHHRVHIPACLDIARARLVFAFLY